MFSACRLYIYLQAACILAGESQTVVDIGNINLGLTQKGIKASQRWNLNNATSCYFWIAVIPDVLTLVYIRLGKVSAVYKDNVTKQLGNLKTSGNSWRNSHTD